MFKYIKSPSVTIIPKTKQKKNRLNFAAFDKQLSNSSLQMQSRVGVRIRFARSLARSHAGLPIRGFIIERADFQGLPRASAKIGKSVV